MLALKFKLFVLRRRIVKGIKSFLAFLFNGVFEILLMALITIYSIIYKIFSIAVGITNLGFVISIVLLVLNIIEVREDNVSFMNTEYFNQMCYLGGIHIVVYFIYKALSIKADVIE